MPSANERPGGEARGVVVGKFQQTDPITTTQAPAIPIQPLVTKDDLEAILRVDKRTIDRMRSSGKLPKPDVMISRFPRWRVETIRGWLERGGK